MLWKSFRGLTYRVPSGDDIGRTDRSGRALDVAIDRPVTVERVVYRSSPVPEVGGRQLDDIFAISIRNNRRDGISGALAVVGDHFVQVLEGEPVCLDRLLERLSVDPRHRDMRILDRRAVTATLFTSWAMARIMPRHLSERALDVLGKSGTAAQVVSLMFQFASSEVQDLV